MSGGSFDYLFHRIEDTYVGQMEDADMDALMKDLCGVLHDLEWYTSGDTSEEVYRKSLTKFKNKWLSGYNKDSSERLKRFKSHLIETIDKEFRGV